MLFKNISLLDENFELQKDVCVRVDGQYITEIARDILPAENEEVISGKSKLLMSGFYNVHMHIPMALMRGYGENLPLDRWLNEKIFPFEDKLNPKYVYNASVLAIAEMIKYGTVSASDMYFFSDEIAKAVAETGFQANISRCIACFDDCDLDLLESFAQTKRLFEDYDGYDNNRIITDTSLHAEYTCSRRIVEQVSQYTNKVGARMQIHLSETQKEQSECLKRHGMTPAEFFDSCGAFESPVTAAHCVWVTDSDIALMAEKGVTAAHCPVSNLKLASGVAPIQKLMKNGVNVALGTDGVASNNNADMLEELKLAAMLHKGVMRDSMLVSAKQALIMATINGAKAQGRSGCGAVKEGNCANLIMMDLNAANMQPVYDAASNVVFSADPGNIVMTMVRGRILYLNGEYKTIDIEKAIYEVNKCKDEILGSM